MHHCHKVFCTALRAPIVFRAGPNGILRPTVKCLYAGLLLSTLLKIWAESLRHLVVSIRAFAIELRFMLCFVLGLCFLVLACDMLFSLDRRLLNAAVCFRL